MVLSLSFVSSFSSSASSPLFLLPLLLSRPVFLLSFASCPEFNALAWWWAPTAPLVHPQTPFINIPLASGRLSQLVHLAQSKITHRAYVVRQVGAAFHAEASRRVLVCLSCLALVVAVLLPRSGVVAGWERRRGGGQAHADQHQFVNSHRPPHGNSCNGMSVVVMRGVEGESRCQVSV